MINIISLIVINIYACVFRKISSIVYVFLIECIKNNVYIILWYYLIWIFYDDYSIYLFVCIRI